MMMSDERWWGDKCLWMHIHRFVMTKGSIVSSTVTQLIHSLFSFIHFIILVHFSWRRDEASLISVQRNVETRMHHSWWFYTSSDFIRRWLTRTDQQQQLLVEAMQMRTFLFELSINWAMSSCLMAARFHMKLWNHDWQNLQQMILRCKIPSTRWALVPGRVLQYALCRQITAIFSDNSTTSIPIKTQKISLRHPWLPRPHGTEGAGVRKRKKI